MHILRSKVGQTTVEYVVMLVLVSLMVLQIGREINAQLDDTLKNKLFRSTADDLIKRVKGG